jgi:transposase
MKRDGRQLDHKTLEELRCIAVRRVIEDQESPSQVAASFGFCRNYLYPWLTKFKEGGWEALCEKIAAGPEPRLTEKQLQQVRRWIVGKDPRQYGFEFGLWTRSIVGELITRKFGIEIGLTAVGRLLAKLNITPQKPLRRAYERDPKEIKQWLREKYPQLRARARKHGAKIFFLDEAGFSSEPNLGRTYGLKGQTPVVPTTGQRQKINAISAINARGEFWCQDYTGKLNAALFVEFLKDFMKGRTDNVYLVVDGHPSHKAKVVKEYVQSTQGRLELHFLPPYAPDLNPDEFVWQYVKTNGVSKKPLNKNESLRDRVVKDLAAVKKNKKLLRSFFMADSVAYAKD